MIPAVLSPLLGLSGSSSSSSRGSVMASLAEMMNQSSPSQRAALMMNTPGNFPRRGPNGGPDTSDQAIADWLVDQGTQFIDFWVGGAGPGAGGNVNGVSLGLPLVLESHTTVLNEASFGFNLSNGIGAPARDVFLVIDDRDGLDVDLITALSVGSQPFSLGPQTSVKARPVTLQNLLVEGESPYSRPLYIGDLEGNEKISMTVTYPAAAGGEVIRLCMLCSKFGSVTGQRQVLSAVQATDGSGGSGPMGAGPTFRSGILGHTRDR